ncbi:MAG: aerobic carbon-monoxide dehydrogenase medium subunit [Frankiaceae bacterium]|jgi:carbon-monoxide dehydrogenase medium subunit|nr:aerobic carbon-monoxide dehydrogenase medium subunit [Frankiaceae bacterium]
MIPAPFEYVRADDAEAALAALSEHGDEAKLLAGGQSLLPLMKLRLAVPAVVVDVSRAATLDYVRDNGASIAIGALTRHATVASDATLSRDLPLLAHAARLVGDPQVRHRGTIGGSVAHADPSADLPTALLALGASYVVNGPSGARTVTADDFGTGFLETVLQPDEMLTEVRVPKPQQGLDGSGWGYEKFTRRAIDWATVAVAAVRRADGTVAVALANMGPTVLRARGVEQAIAAGSGSVDAAAHADAETEPAADVTASADYRRHLARILTARALDRCLTGN